MLDLAMACIRPWRVGDGPSLARHANNPSVSRNMRDRFPHPYSLADAQTFIAASLSQDPQTVFAIAVDDAAVGGIGYTLHDDVERVAAEIGYWIGVDYWGRGIMSTAVAAFTRWVFDRHPELRRLYAVPMAWNRASARVLEKAGYRLEGRMRESAIKNGLIVDQFLYAILRDELGPSG